MLPAVERRVLRRTESHLEVDDGGNGLLLFRRAWLPPEPRRVLLFVHGLAEHSGRYDHVAAWFAARDSAVHAYDQRGHGRSGGTPVFVSSFSEYLDDLERVLARIQAEHPGQPVTLIGHSMGGLIVAGLLGGRAPELANAVLSGPALAVGEHLPWPRRAAMRVLRRVAPRLAVPNGVDPAGLSRDAAVVDAYLADPLVPRRITVSLAAELVDASRRTLDDVRRIRTPLLLLHGEADPVCPARATRTFHACLQAPGSRLHVYPKLRHEIFNEPEQEQVFEDVLGWLREREA